MQPKTFFLQALDNPQHTFADTLTFIETWFTYTPSAFRYGKLHSSATENQGSCKIFALAQLFELTQQQTLLCFGEHYRNLEHTPVSSHLNLRQLAQLGLINLEFEHFPLTPKDS